MASKPSTSPTASAGGRTPRTRRLPRWLRRIVGAGLAGIVLALFSAIIILTQTSLVSDRVLPRLSEALNLDVEADSVYIAWNGHLVLDSARFRLDGIEGPAAEFLTVRKVRISVNWWRSMRSDVHIRGVRMIEPVLTVSQSLDDRSLNIGRLILPTPPTAAEGQPPALKSAQVADRFVIPTIVAQNARLELGEHLGASYTPLKSIIIDGRFAPSRAEAETYEFSLAEDEGNFGGEGEPLRVSGTYTPERIELTVRNFSLDRWPAEDVPSPVRSFFSDLDLKGSVPAATLSYTEEEGITARLDLQGVAMNLPIEPQLQPAAALPPGAEPLVGPLPRFMRLYDTEGTITFGRDSVFAQVHGRLEDLPYRVTWMHQGTSPNSPFTCDFVSENFQLDRAPALLPFAPPAVVQRLREFSSPTATVNTYLTVRRGEPMGDQPGLITVSGHARLREGVAAFEGFPYEFQNISGTFRFTNDKIELEDFEGRSRSGARMEASGLIAPLDDDAQVDVTVSVRRTPMDDALIQAFGERHRDLVPTLFNRERYDELLARGLLRTSSQAEREQTELESLREAAVERQLDAESASRRAHLETRSSIPAFDLGGNADITVTIHRPYGESTPWQTTIDIRLPNAGLLPSVFPYPIVGREVQAHIDNNEGRITGGVFQGVSGGTADVAASFTVPLVGSDPPTADILLRTSDLPLDRLLFSALPGDEQSAYRRMLLELGLSGKGSGTIRIANRELEDGSAGELGFDANVKFEGLEIRPDPLDDQGSLGLTGVDAQLRVNEREMSLQFSGEASASGYTGDMGGPLSGLISARFDGWDEEARTTYNAEIAWPDLPVHTPLEALIWPLSREGAQQIAVVRSAYRPQGRISAAAQLAAGGDQPSVNVRLKGARDLSFDVLDDRAQISDSSGSVTISTWPEAVATFDGFEAPLHFAGDPAGLVQLAGQWGLAERTDLFHAMRIGLRDVMIESPLIREVLKRNLARETIERLEELQLEGIVDAEVALVPGADGPDWRTIRVEPQQLAMDVDGTPVIFNELSGMIELEPGGSGLLRDFTATAPTWTIRANAAWRKREDASYSVRSSFGLSGSELSPDLRAILPVDVRGLMDDVSLKVGGPFELSDGRLNVTQDSTGRTGAIDFFADARFQDASMNVGFDLSDLRGTMSGRYERQSAESTPQFRFDLDVDSFKAAAISMTEGVASVVSGTDRGEVLIENASAEAHEGRISGSARITPLSMGDENARRQYNAAFQLSGVRFNPILREFLGEDDQDGDLLAGAALKLPGADDEQPGDVPEAGDLSRGIVDGQLALSGIVGDPLARRGRGSLRISEGRVLSLPLVLTLIEVSNLQPPVNARLDFASADFYIDGGLIVFTGLAVSSRSLEILGQGTMTWPEQILDLRFDTRSSRPIPLLSHIVKGIRDELVTTTVRGPLGEHEVRLQQLPRSRRMLGVGPPRDLTPEERQDDLQQRSRSGADRRERGGSFGPGISPTRPGSTTTGSEGVGAR